MTNSHGGTLGAAAIVALVVLAYLGNANTWYFAVAVGVLLLLISRPPIQPLKPLDWAVLLSATYEIPSLLLSRYSANGLRTAMALCLAALVYLWVRLAVRTPHQTRVVAVLIGAGGGLISFSALIRFNEQAELLEANGLLNIVAFRAILLSPPASWVIGECLTLLLLTLPFAFSASFWCWLARRRALALQTALMSALVAAVLLTSCSRAVFWSLLLFPAVVAVVSVAYQVLQVRTALLLTASAVCTLVLTLVIENAVYPGLAVAYIGRQTSQTRSTEGRLAIWKRSVDVFMLSPLRGVGSGNAALFLAASADEDQTTGFASRTFSLPIQILTEKGIVGAALYLAVLLLAGWEAHRKLRDPTTSPQVKAMTCCLVAGVIAVLFRELTYSSLLEHPATAMLFTMSLALIVAREPE